MTNSGSVPLKPMPSRLGGGKAGVSAEALGSPDRTGIAGLSQTRILIKERIRRTRRSPLPGAEMSRGASMWPPANSPFRGGLMDLVRSQILRRRKAGLRSVRAENPTGAQPDEADCLQD